MGRACNTNGEKRNICGVLSGKPEGKSSLGSLIRRCLGNFKMCLRDIVWGGINWVDLAQDRPQWRVLVNGIMNLRIQYNPGKFLSCCTNGGFTRRAQLHEVS
jgi:hypothetical protein